jgi:WD40 repeat protein
MVFNLLLLSYLFKLSNFYILVDVKSQSELILSGPKYEGIYLFDVKANSVKKLYEGNAYKLALSPARDRIVYRDYNKVKLLHFDGTERVVAEQPEKVGFPVWVDDTLIAYAYNGEILIVDTLGNLKHSISGVRSYYIDYSPKAKMFAFQEDDQIYLIDWSGNKKKISVEGTCFAPIFSPDGFYVAYNEMSKGIYLYNLNLNENFYVSKGSNPCFSSDGSLIAFNISQDDGHNITASEIYIYSVSGKIANKITNTKEISEIRPMFSPDGKRIYFCSPEGQVGYLNSSKFLR